MSAESATTEEQVRQVIAEFGRLSGDVSSLSPGADLYQLGLTSHASVNVMLGLEDAFDVEFPDRLLRKATFASISAICSAIDEVLALDAARA